MWFGYTQTLLSSFSTYARTMSNSTEKCAILICIVTRIRNNLYEEYEILVISHSTYHQYKLIMIV